MIPRFLLFFGVVLGYPHNPHASVMPATNQPPGPAPQQEPHVPQLLSDDRCDIFLKDCNIKPIFNRTSHTLTALVKAQSKITFLKNCLKNEVVPVTLRVKFTPPNRDTAAPDNSYTHIIKESSIRILKVAIKESQKNCQQAASKYNESLSVLKSKAQQRKVPVEWLEEKLQKHQRKVYKQ